MASNSNDDFLARAQAATQRVVASAAAQQSASPEQAKIVQELAQDRPTIQAAITSFLSLVAARSLVAPEILAQQQQQQLSNSPPLLVLSNAQALQCSRALLKAINATTLCATTSTTDQPTTEAIEYDLVAQVWNGLVASEQKPCRFLGRRSLRHAWEDVKQDAALQLPPASSPGANRSEDEAKQQQQQQQARFVEEFGRLLFVNSRKTAPEDDDDDAALLWSPDGGKQELQRRRDRRQKRASNNSAAAATEGEEQKLPFIEELTGEDES